MIPPKRIEILQRQEATALSENLGLVDVFDAETLTQVHATNPAGKPLFQRRLMNWQFHVRNSSPVSAITLCRDPNAAHRQAGGIAALIRPGGCDLPEKLAATLFWSDRSQHSVDATAG